MRVGAIHCLCGVYFVCGFRVLGFKVDGHARGGCGIVVVLDLVVETLMVALDVDVLERTLCEGLLETLCGVGLDMHKLMQ